MSLSYKTQCYGCQHASFDNLTPTGKPSVHSVGDCRKDAVIADANLSVPACVTVHVTRSRIYPFTRIPATQLKNHRFCQFAPKKGIKS